MAYGEASPVGDSSYVVEFNHATLGNIGLKATAGEGYEIAEAVIQAFVDLIDGHPDWVLEVAQKRRTYAQSVTPTE